MEQMKRIKETKETKKAKSSKSTSLPEPAEGRIAKTEPVNNQDIHSLKAYENVMVQSLRPSSFDEFPGQDTIKNKLKVFVSACLKRGEPLDHCLLSGPPGLGKTTLAHIIANHLEMDMKSTSGPAIRRKGDIAAILTTMRAGTVLFIDEIHRLAKEVEEYLYSAMEDFHIDIMTGEGFGARSVRFQLSPFTLIGATTRIGLLKAPFRDRFGILERLSFYDQKSLKVIITRSSGLLKVSITEEGVAEIARRSRGTPRIANRLLKRVRDFAQVYGTGKVDQKQAERALEYLGVDEYGLDFMDVKILTLMKDHFQGGPVGVDTLSAVLGEETDTLEDFYEPFLIQQGLVKKTARGRVLTDKAYNHLEKHFFKKKKNDK